MASGPSKFRNPFFSRLNTPSYFEDKDWRLRRPNASFPDDDVAMSLTYMEKTYTRTSDDIWKKVLKHGHGERLVEGAFMMVTFQIHTFNAEGKLCEMPFDSSWHGAEHVEDRFPGMSDAVPKKYRLMSGEELGVFDKGVATMKVGETANFVARGAAAYGANGLTGNVEPNAPIFLQVTVLEGRKPTTTEKILQGVLTDKTEASLDEIYKAVFEFNRRGCVDFQFEDLRPAIGNYNRGLDWSEEDDRMHSTPADLHRFQNIRFYLFNNLSACYLKLDQFQDVVTCANLALASTEIPGDLKHTELGKLYYRLAQALFEINEHDKTTEAIEKAKEYLPRNHYAARFSVMLQEIEMGNKENNPHHV